VELSINKLDVGGDDEANMKQLNLVRSLGYVGEKRRNGMGVNEKRSALKALQKIEESHIHKLQREPRVELAGQLALGSRLNRYRVLPGVWGFVYLLPLVALPLIWTITSLAGWTPARERAGVPGDRRDHHQLLGLTCRDSAESPPESSPEVGTICISLILPRSMRGAGDR